MQAAPSGMMQAGGGAMLAQQQQMQAQFAAMQAAAAARPGGLQGMMRPGMPPGGGLPPGATVTLMPTPQGMVPFLIQPGKQPIMLSTGLPTVPMGAVGQQAGAAAAAAAAAAFPFPGFPGAMQLPRPGGK